jgi:hypothetical protein
MAKRPIKMSELTGVRFSLEDLKAIEDYRRAQPQIPPKGTAIRELVRIGLETWKRQTAASGKRGKPEN